MLHLRTTRICIVLLWHVYIYSLFTISKEEVYPWFNPYMRTQPCTLGARTSTTRYPTVLNVTQRHTLYSANQTAGNTIEGVWINTTVAIIPERGDEGCHCSCR